jgi:hypothetical protein
MNAHLFVAALFFTLGAISADAEVIMVGNFEFELSPSLANDSLADSLHKASWDRIPDRLLMGYNYGKISDGKGNIIRIVVSGKSDSDGVNADEPRAETQIEHPVYDDLLIYQGSSGEVIPEKYRGLPAGSVMEISLPVARLQQMEIGEKIALTLPTSTHTLVYENRFEHDNGDQTWVGYLEDSDSSYRVTVTSGQYGSWGQIATPEGAYDIELGNGRNWLVDLSAIPRQGTGYDEASVDRFDPEASEEAGNQNSTCAVQRRRFSSGCDSNLVNFTSAVSN